MRSMNNAPAAAASRATAPAMAATLEPVLATVFLLPLPVAPGLLVLPGFCSSGPGATALALTVTLKVAVTPR